MPSLDNCVLFRRPWRRVRRRPLLEFLREISRGRAITCLITTDREMRALNRRFRGRDYAADVLSFPSGPAPLADARGSESGNGTAGEIAISFERAAEQAGAHGHTVDQELRILMLHGVLHLAGMDHETDNGRMARAEARWRKRLGLPRSLTERT